MSKALTKTAEKVLKNYKERKGTPEARLNIGQSCLNISKSGYQSIGRWELNDGLPEALQLGQLARVVLWKIFSAHNRRGLP